MPDRKPPRPDNNGNDIEYGLDSEDCRPLKVRYLNHYPQMSLPTAADESNSSTAPSRYRT
jgi:hypothetical protein